VISSCLRDRQRPDPLGIYREIDVAKIPDLTRALVPFKTIEQGATTTVWCAVSPQLNGKGAVYWEDCDIAPIVPAHSRLNTGLRHWAVNKAAAGALWVLSKQLTAISAASVTY
jgi:hypothetical protein